MKIARRLIKRYSITSPAYVSPPRKSTPSIRKRPHIIERLTISGMPGHIRSHEEIKELQRIRAERKAHTKRRKKRAQKEPELLPMEQDDTFFFIAGYTSGGVPYGLTWEEMGLEPWEDTE